MGSLPKSLSASRGAAALGLSKYKSPFELWAELVWEADPEWAAQQELPKSEFAGNAATRLGTAFETAVCGLAAAVRGGKIIRREEYFEKGYLTCHIDGFYSGENVLHEGKTTNLMRFNSPDWGEPGTDRVPAEYFNQAQHQMLCTGAESVVVSVLILPQAPDKIEALGWACKESAGNHYLEKDGLIVDPSYWAAVLNEMGFFKQYFIPADLDIQDKMQSRYREFWDMVTSRTPPPPKYNSDFKWFMKAAGEVLATPEIMDNLQMYMQLNAENKDIANRKDASKAAVLQYMAAQSPTSLESKSDFGVDLLSPGGGQIVARVTQNNSGTLLFNLKNKKTIQEY